MLRTDSFGRTATAKPILRVGAATRSSRSGAFLKRDARSARTDAVEIQAKRFGYFPQRFRWRGKTREVQAVERCWTRTGSKARLCFRVRCDDGVFDLTQHVKTNVWTLAVVQFNSQ
jgi:hypothetical protein